jgi:DnaJ-class molecular chaperone
MSGSERKQLRKAWYEKYVFKNKMITCVSCNGSGYYDNSVKGRTPKCGNCNGKGKVYEKQFIPFCLFK